MQTNTRLAYFILVLSIVAGCAAADVAPSPDAAPIALSPVGHYDVRTQYVFAAPPPEAVRVLAELEAATDGADDPARYLVDKLVARVPDDMREVATRLAPYLAAYLQNRISSFAPELAPSIREMSMRTAELAKRIETVEELTITSDGIARRSVFALRVGPEAIDFTQIDPMVTSATLSGDQLQFGTHAFRVPYGSMLRAGFDHGVLPQVVPNAHDLATALGTLVDCPRLGALVAEWMGVGSPEFYARACSASLTLVAADVYAKVGALDEQPFVIEMMGVAHGRDVNGDGGMDRVEEGRWIGAFGTAIFEGGRR